MYEVKILITHVLLNVVFIAIKVKFYFVNSSLQMLLVKGLHLNT